MTPKEFWDQWGAIITTLTIAVPSLLSVYLNIRKMVLDSQAKKQELLIEDKKIVIEDKDKTVDRANQVNAMYEAIAAKMEERMKFLEASLTVLQADKLIKDQNILDLQQKNKDLTVTVEALEIKVRQRDKMITDRDVVIKDQTQRIELLEKETHEFEIWKRKQEGVTQKLWNGGKQLWNQLKAHEIEPGWSPEMVIPSGIIKGE